MRQFCSRVRWDEGSLVFSNEDWSISKTSGISLIWRPKLRAHEAGRTKHKCWSTLQVRCVNETYTTYRRLWGGTVLCFQLQHPDFWMRSLSYPCESCHPHAAFDEPGSIEVPYYRTRDDYVPNGKLRDLANQPIRLGFDNSSFDLTDCCWIGEETGSHFTRPQRAHQKCIEDHWSLIESKA